MEYTYDRHSVEMNAAQLAAEIEEQLKQGSKVTMNPTTITIWFEAPLSPGDKLTLDQIVADHVAETVIEHLPNPGYAMVAGFDAARAKPLQVTRTVDGQEFTFWCLVTKDLKDAYDAGQLNIGDYISLVYIDSDVNVPLAQQKIVKTW